MDAYEERKQQWEDLEVSREEMETLTKCMKEEQFRKLLIEYAEEVNDPENRKLYEAEITQLERERGIEVTFVNPEPGYVIKTSVDGRTKCFINVSMNGYVGKPTNEPSRGVEGNGGYNWSIPYVLAPPRDDLDKRKTRCRVFDVVFHPESMRLAKANHNFRDMVNDTAMDGIENNFKVKLDRKNLKFPKMNFKGMAHPTVIRRPCDKPVKQSETDPEIYQKLMSSYDESRERWLKSTEERCPRPTPTTKYYNSQANETEDKNSEYTKPKFVVKYQTSFDMDEFRESKDAKMHSAIPKNLVIIINLPLLKSADCATLDVQARHLTLKSEKPAKYWLELPLSYTVDSNNGSAKFDPKLRRLTVTLPVIRDMSFLLDTKEDSGVESDHGSPLPESQVINNHLAQEGDLSDGCKPKNGSLICVLNENDKVQSDCADTALRTSEDTKTAVPFMNPNVKYSLPPFTCNLYDNLFAITIHVKNVDTESIHYKILQESSGLHIILTSIGAGFFPIYYSLCMKIRKDAVVSDTLTVEPWDNNVVLSIQINEPEVFSRYFVGTDEEFMEIKDLSVAVSIQNKLQALMEDPEIETDKNVEVIRNENEVIVNVCSESVDSDDDDEHESKLNSETDEQKRTQSRSISESSGDEFASSIASSTGSARYKSILKTGHNRFSRSISESSIDDSTAPLHSATFNDFVQELNSESEGSSLKKTVRFNDVVSRQLFRSNSSIFGQRKKNQRKLKNKKRAQERRLSESENSEGEEREKYKAEVKNETEQDVSDAVRPILHQSNKQSEARKTANIEIERTPRNANKRKQKRNTKNDKINPTKGEETAKIEDNSKGVEPWKTFDGKNYLMFDLEV
ncbi:PREDICTED: protein kintoun [Ceratosolen solmsi marchali]|uniref:Protein kintoun n=1 Tax=Ceratosolen solmsi marchali TaxID=326594 RepID=A0AAJ6YHZ1_9HYME|nr:PREDICTED: protein kintoun [Ceratosolen solmsi marchali]